MIPEEAQRRHLESVRAGAIGEATGEGRAAKPYLDMASTRRRLQVLAWLAVVGVAVAEITVISAGSLGVVLYGILTLVLLLGGGRATSRRLRVLAWSLAVIPISRLVAFGAPLGTLGVEGRIGFVGLLTLVATVTAMRTCNLSRTEVGWTVRSRDVALACLMVIVGLCLGIVERAAVVSLPYQDAASLAVIVTVAVVSLGDVLLFQGLLLETTRRIVGWMAIPLIALLVAVLHVGYGSWPLAACAALVSGVLSWARLATGTLTVAVAGQLAFAWGAFVVGPMVAPGLRVLVADLLRTLGF